MLKLRERSFVKRNRDAYALFCEQEGLKKGDPHADTRFKRAFWGTFATPEDFMLSGIECGPIRFYAIPGRKASGVHIFELTG